jgi:hypothetical protein
MPGSHLELVQQRGDMCRRAAAALRQSQELQSLHMGLVYVRTRWQLHGINELAVVSVVAKC